MKNAKKLLGDNTERLRNEKDMTQPELAEAAGLSVQMIQKIEYAKTNPSAETLNKLARGLGCEIHDLFRTGPASVILGPRSAAAVVRASRSGGPPLTVGEMTPDQMEDLVSRASKRENTINMELERVRKELADLKATLLPVPTRVIQMWPKVSAEIQAVAEYMITGKTNFEGFLLKDLAKIRTSLQTASTKAPKGNA